MILQWVQDNKTFKFKTIHKITNDLILIEILFDDVSQSIVNGKIVVKTEVFNKIDNPQFCNLSVESAKLFMLKQTIEDYNDIALADYPSEVPQEVIIASFADINATYLHYLSLAHVDPHVVQYRENGLKELEMLKEFEAASKEPLPHGQLRVLRNRLLQEEFNEVKDALIEGNIHHIAKEVCDLKYVCYGTLLSFELELEEMIYFASWKFFKESVKNKDELIFHATKKTECCLQSVFDNSSPEFFNQSKVTKALVNTLAVVDCCCFEKNLPVHECFKEVHRSNMSKFGQDGIPVRNEYGKVIKGPHYSPADFSHIFVKA